MIKKDYFMVLHKFESRNKAAGKVEFLPANGHDAVAKFVNVFGKGRRHCFLSKDSSIMRQKAEL